MPRGRCGANSFPGEEIDFSFGKIKLTLWCLFAAVRSIPNSSGVSGGAGIREAQKF